MGLTVQRDSIVLGIGVPDLVQSKLWDAIINDKGVQRDQ